MLPFLLTLTDESNHGKIEDIYNKYHEYMLKYAIVKLRGAGRQNAVYDAEDVVQNTFVKITKYINNFDFSRDERDVKNYCFSILNNEICNLLSDNEIFFELNEEFYNENEYNYIEKLEIQENYNKIVKIIEKLDEKYSTTLYLVFCKEMSVNQISEMMGISAKTVYTRLARGKKLLLDSLKGEKNDE